MSSERHDIIREGYDWTCDRCGVVAWFSCAECDGSDADRAIQAGWASGWSDWLGDDVEWDLCPSCVLGFLGHAAPSESVDICVRCGVAYPGDDAGEGWRRVDDIHLDACPECVSLLRPFVGTATP